MNGGICVAHLVRYANGISPLVNFLSTYCQKPSGADHELLLIMKGFPEAKPPQEYVGLLRSIVHHEIYLPDSGFDIGAYFEAARTVDHRYVCFLNSFSTIRYSGWLRFLYEAAICPGIGVAGTSGSWESVTSGLKRRFRENFNVSLRSGARYGAAYIFARRHYPLFPNPHLRTNGFFIDRCLFLGLRRWPMRRKQDALRFESGRYGMTRQLLHMGLEPVVVGLGGQVFRKELWDTSKTFRTDQQANLLVDDNQTRAFLQATPYERRLFSLRTWGRATDNFAGA